VVLQGAVSGYSAAAQELCSVAQGLGNSGIPIHLALQNTSEVAEALVAAPNRIELEKLTYQKLNVPQSVLYYGSLPTIWNLDYYGSCRVGRAAFWSDSIPQDWIEPCNALDEIWVPSEFHRESFAASGVVAEKLRLVPTGVDTNLFQPGLPPLPIPGRRKFNFLSVTGEDDRKATDLLLTAFLREFCADDDVSLTLKMPRKAESRSNLAGEIAFFIEKSLNVDLEKSADVILLEENLPQHEMPYLYAAADAFVLPARGTSMGTVLLQALAYELPVITTRWGASLEFLNDENSYLIDLEGLTPVASPEEFLPGHNWANPSVDHLRGLMRQVFANADEAKARAAKGRNRIKETRDWNVVLPRWQCEFRRLLS
jgi:glycosyltransferase involved in cell wall biosynthesis